MDIEEDDEQLLDSVVSKKRHCRLKQAREMSALHWENSNGSEAPDCLPGRLGCLHS